MIKNNLIMLQQDNNEAPPYYATPADIITSCFACTALRRLINNM